MTLQDETKCIATPGFAGFMPSLKYQFGLTYGNATRHILRTDSSLKKGQIQQDLARKRAQKAHPAHQAPTTDDGPSDALVWKMQRNKYATGDDRFSFPPVPGYTGYIPRSQEHFGRPYVETTNASLASFQAMLKSKNELPPRIQAIKAKQAPYQSSSSTSAPSLSTGVKLPDATQKTNKKTFISGYTGYVPRLQNYFGEPYSESVRQAITEFSTPRPPHNPYSPTTPKPKIRALKSVKTSPIPGFTGYIPGSRTCYSTTFGKTSEISYDNFNHRDDKGRITSALTSPLPAKDLSKTLPIPGYRGHIPSYIYSAERSYGISSKECIKNFSSLKAADGKSGSA